MVVPKQSSAEDWSGLLTIKSISNPNAFNENCIAFSNSSSQNMSNGREPKQKKVSSGPKLIKGTWKSKWTGDIGQQPSTTSRISASTATACNDNNNDSLKKKNSIVRFVENLQQIEKKPANSGNNIVDETNDEINVAFQQLEELKKMLAHKIKQQTVMELKSNSTINRTNKSSGFVQLAEMNRRLDKIKKDFNRNKKPRIHYKSLHDFETLISHSTEMNDEDVLEKPSPDIYSLSNSQSKSTTSSIAATTTDNMTTSTATAISKNQLNNYHTEYFYKNSATSEGESDDYFYELDDVDEQKDDKRNVCNAATEAQASPRPTDKFGQFVSYAFGENKQKASLYKSIFQNSNKLEESILKSQYLLKEFTVDAPMEGKFFQVGKEKAAEKRSAHLFEAAIHKKFQDTKSCQVANLKERDRKLYKTINRSLKNSLYTTIEE